MRKEKRLHILFTGGGTLGPVTPLLVLKDRWAKEGVSFSWIGTLHGPEKEFLADQDDMSFYGMFAPKLSRSQKWKWLFLPFSFLVSLVWAFILLRKIRPSIIYTAGGYVSVPLFVIGRLMGIPLWVHQLDVLPGIANRVMAKIADRVSTTFPDDEGRIGGVCVGGLVRDLKGDPDRAAIDFNLDPTKPTIFVMGGGTGAVQLNDAILALKEDLLSHVNIVHSYGRGKMPSTVNSEPGYYAAELLRYEEVVNVYSCTDLLVARGGLGTLLEAVKWQLPLIMIPIEGSQQEQNAELVEEARAGVVLRRMNPQMLLNAIQNIMDNRLEREAMVKNMGTLVTLGAEEVIVEESKLLLDV